MTVDLGTTCHRTGEHRPTPSDVSSARARLATLITEHLDGLYRSALRLTPNRTAAEDLVQGVISKAGRSFHTLPGGISIRPWLHRILMDAVFDLCREPVRDPGVAELEDVGDFSIYEEAREGATPGEARNPEMQVLDQLTDVEVRDSLEALPLRYRSTVLLADVQGFSYNEIADILGIPVRTVMSRLSRGRHAFQRRLWEYARDRTA